MNTAHDLRHHEVIVIGASQAGLAAGYHLLQHGIDSQLLTADSNPGDTWRNRWDSLKLFTPAKYCGLPGVPFPAPDKLYYPGKDEVADYLDSYAERFNIPVQVGVTAQALRKDNGVFELDTTAGVQTADNVIIATGTNQRPYVPEFAPDLNREITQIHSSEYKRPSAIPGTDTLVVGAGTSGLEIALELAHERNVYLSGKPTPHIPDIIVYKATTLLWWFANHVATVRTPIGRKIRREARSHGAPLERISAEDAQEAGAELVPRVAGTTDGLPALDGGRVLEIDSVIWCTGYRPDYSWIEMDLPSDKGWPETDRGATGIDGLYFLGTLFQYSLASGLTGGVGRDAGWVVDHIVENRIN